MPVSINASEITHVLKKGACRKEFSDSCVFSVLVEKVPLLSLGV